MTNRTAVANGSIANNGNVPSTYNLRLVLRHHAAVPGGVDVGPLLEEAISNQGPFTLSPGQSSGNLSIAGALNLNDSEWLFAQVFLDRSDPAPAVGIDSSPSSAFQEPVSPVPAGALSGFTPSLSINFGFRGSPRARQRQLGRARR